jgi:glycerophosphoryl diester phosphodiesterase
MKRKFILLIACFLFICRGSGVYGLNGSKADGHEKTNIEPLSGLDNYAIPVNVRGALIGKLIVTSETKPRAKIIKDTSGLFRIDREGNISLKRKVKLLPSDASVSYMMTVKTGSRQKEFELVRDDFLRNKVVAHRGAWKHFNASENSLNALKHAIELGCAWSEFDVWMAADGIPVVNHDPRAGGYEIEKTPSTDLKKIALKGDDFLPALEQYLLTIKSQNRTRLVLEIKPSQVSLDRTLELTEKVVRMVHDLRAQAWVTYISFSYQALVRVMELDPMAKTAYLGSDTSVEKVWKDKMWGIDFNGKMFVEDKDLIRKAHDLGLKVNVWTINDPSDMKALLVGGVDYITTNEPEILLEMLH